MSISSKSIPIRRHDELEDIRPDAHHEVVTTADIDARIDSHSKIPHAHHEVVTRADVGSDIETHRLVPDAHHEVVTQMDILTQIDNHNGLTSVHPTATSIGGRNIGFHDNDIAVLPTGTVGQILRRGLFNWEAFTPEPAGGGDFVLVSEANITSPHTSVFFGGLDINAVGGYCLLLEATHELNVDVWYFIYINEDTNHLNYRMQRVFFNATTIHATRLSMSGILRVETNDRTGFSTARMTLVNNRFHCLAEASQGLPASNHLYSFAVRHINPQTNVTSLRITANNTSGIGIGSRIRLYRL